MSIIRVTLVMASAVVLVGCRSVNLGIGSRGGPAYTVRGDKIGSGEQAIVPRNNSRYWNGEPMDFRQ